MNNKKSAAIFTIATCCVITLILDSKTAFYGAFNGIKLCLESVIPSLFPFFYISIILTNLLKFNSNSTKFKRFLNIPQEYTSYLLLGYISGYPVGAKNVHQAYTENRISKDDAERLIPLCNNAGPAFIFGMLSHIFPKMITLWFLWGIQILSSLIVANFTKLRGGANIPKTQARSISFTDALKTAISAMASVCSWVIIFKTFLSIINKRLLYGFPSTIAVIFTGLCELANGCSDLSMVSYEPLRFLLCTAFLSFGGLCVTLQTTSVISPLSIKHYIPTKAAQCFISVIIAYISLPIVYPSASNRFFSTKVSILLIILYIIRLISKKTVAFLKIMLYNKEKLDMRGLPYDF